MDLQTIESEALAQIESVTSLADLEAVHVRYLGRKDGQLTYILKSIGSLPPDEKKKIGQGANQLRLILEEKWNSKKKTLEDIALTRQLSSTKIDLTLPGLSTHRGGSHPISRAIYEITSIFKSIGFDAVQGPDIESDFNNFTALNIPPHHPARDMHDTFYLDLNEETPQGKPSGQALLRTHTSPVQVRYMQKVKPPLRIVAPGRVYRHEAVDATHGAIFHQIEGLAVDTHITFADLKGSLTYFVKKYFGPKLAVRFRPGYFPFVEPGAEMDVQCFVCMGEKHLKDGRPCSLCKRTGWIEMLGAGMVHPNVFRAVGYDPEKVTGFAFGMGIERIVMTRFGINDIRLLLDSDLRFLEQFK